MQILKRLLFLFILFTSTTQAQTFTFLTHFIKPFAYEEKGEIKGFAVEIVKEMMKMQKHPIKFRFYPFKRALLKVQNNPNYALFIVAKRPERENTLKWVGPLISSGVYFYKKKGNPLQINNLEDLKKLRYIGVGRGNSDHTFLKNNGFTNLISTNNQMQSIIMLNKGRTDTTPISEIVMPEMAKQAGIAINSIEKTNFKLYDSVLFLAFSKDTPDKIIEKWQKALDTLKASGKYQKIYAKFIK